MIKTCKRCQKEFIPKGNKAIYCPECRPEVHREQAREWARNNGKGKFEETFLEYEAWKRDFALGKTVSNMR